MIIGAEVHVWIPFTVRERPYLRRVLQGVADFAAEKNRRWRLHTPFYHYWAGTETIRKNLPPLDGFISGVPEPSALQHLRDLGLPGVLIGYHPRPEWASNALIDFDELADKAVEHYARQKITSVALCGSMKTIMQGHDDLSARMAAKAAAAGLLFQVYSKPFRFEAAAFEAWICDLACWLKHLPTATGLFCADDEYAGLVLLAAHKASLVIGRDLLLMGCGNDIAYCTSQHPPLSSMRLGYYALGKAAAAELERILTHPDTGGKTKMVRVADVAMRLSSRRSGGPGSLVQRALSYIWQDIGEVGGVEQIARRLGVERSTLRRHFVAELGHTPAEELRLARIETAKSLLREGRLPLSEVAARCGFADQAHMGRELRKATGLSPKALRDKLSAGL